MTEPRRLGTSSLEALQDLAGPTGATESLLNVPVGELHFDPHQPRNDFTGDQVDPADREKLHALAENLSRVGFIQPLRIRPRQDGDGYFVVTGECRLRAAVLKGFETVPCVLDLENERPDQRLLVQISENLLRSDLKLLDLAKALDDLANRSELSDKDLARMLGRSKAWFSAHRGVLRAKGLARKALEENLVRSPEAVRLLGKLPEKKQQRLLHQARESQQPIPRRLVRGLVEKLKGKTGDVRDPETKKRDRLYVLRLEEADVRRLSAFLQADLPESPTDWIPRLLEAIAGLPDPA